VFLHNVFIYTVFFSFIAILKEFVGLLKQIEVKSLHKRIQMSFPMQQHVYTFFEDNMHMLSKREHARAVMKRGKKPWASHFIFY
jgi:hypothetical protein